MSLESAPAAAAFPDRLHTLAWPCAPPSGLLLSSHVPAKERPSTSADAHKQLFCVQAEGSPLCQRQSAVPIMHIAQVSACRLGTAVVSRLGGPLAYLQQGCHVA